MGTVITVVLALFLSVLYCTLCASICRNLAIAKGYPVDWTTILLGAVASIFAVLWYYAAPAKNGCSPIEIRRSLSDSNHLATALLIRVFKFGLVASCLILIVAFLAIRFF